MTPSLFTSPLERLIKTSIVLFCYKNNNKHTHTHTHLNTTENYWRVQVQAEGSEKNKDSWGSLTGLTHTKYCLALNICKFRSKLIKKNKKNTNPDQFFATQVGLWYVLIWITWFDNCVITHTFLFQWPTAVLILIYIHQSFHSWTEIVYLCLDSNGSREPWCVWWNLGHSAFIASHVMFQVQIHVSRTHQCCVIMNVIMPRIDWA